MSTATNLFSRRPADLPAKARLFRAEACVLIGMSVLLCLYQPDLVLAHEGHADAPGEGGAVPVGAPVEVSAAARTNLGLMTVEADLLTIETVLKAIGVIEAVPDRHAFVSSRISGRVKIVHANIGGQVKKGEVLAVIESRMVGDPPPTVNLRSPISGVVADRHAVVGQNISPDEHLFEVMDLSEVYVEGRIYEGQIAAVRSGQKARARLDAFPGEVFEGRLELVGSILDERTRSLKVWAKIANPGLRVKPNMRADLSIVIGEADLVLAVPLTAVLGEAGHYLVFVEGSDTNTFERREVVTGIRDDRFVEIKSGVLIGDNVVTQGNYQLQYVPPKAKEGDDKKESDDGHGGQSH